MGNTYVIMVWDGPVGGPFTWLEVYRGEKFYEAIYWMWWCKRNGWKSIRLEYRP